MHIPQELEAQASQARGARLVAQQLVLGRKGPDRGARLQVRSKRHPDHQRAQRVCRYAGLQPAGLDVKLFHLVSDTHRPGAGMCADYRADEGGDRLNGVEALNRLCQQNLGFFFGGGMKG